MAFKFAILGLLADGPLHGYELKAAYEKDLVPTAQLNFGQVYTTLERLHRNGFVEFEEVNQTERPDKKVYRLTEQGRHELDNWLADPGCQSEDSRSDTYLKLMLAQRVDGISVLKCLATERRACIQRLQELSKAKTKAENDGASFQTVLLVELAILRMEALLQWLDRCREVLKKEKK